MINDKTEEKQGVYLKERIHTYVAIRGMCLQTKTCSLLYDPQIDLFFPRFRSTIACVTTSCGWTLCLNTFFGTECDSTALSMNAVSTQPGDTSRTLIPLSFSSILRDSVKLRT